MMKKIGNYKWVYCRKCGKQYIWTPTRGSNHKCIKINEQINNIFNFIYQKIVEVISNKYENKTNK